MAKLVEILARDLADWPGQIAAMAQDANAKVAGFTHKDLDYHGGGNGWAGRLDGYNAYIRESRFECELADDYATAIVTRAEWQAAVDALKPDAQRFAEDYVEANKDRHVKEWDGVGLPPVGTVCEWAGCTYAPEDPKEPDLHIGDQVTIIAHFKDGELDLAAFIFNPQIHNHNRGTASVNQGAHGCFRPIRTPEQIEADEREKHISDICMIFDRDPNSPTNRNHAARLYDAGYRKQEPK